LGRQADLRKWLAKFWLTLRHQIFGQRYRRLTIEQVDDVSLIVLPDVFNPVLFRTGEFLARAVQSTSILQEDANPAPLVLDLGCGSGIGGVFAARRGSRVIAVDVNPEAIRCARLNAILNRVDDKIEPRCGDLFAPVPDERFDLVLFNPPFYRGQPGDDLDRAWRGEAVFERFASCLAQHLKVQGQALIVLSTDGEGDSLLKELARNGFATEPIARRDFVNEVITVYQVGRAASSSEKNDHSL